MAVVLNIQDAEDFQSFVNSKDGRNLEFCLVRPTICYKRSNSVFETPYT